MDDSIGWRRETIRAHSRGFNAAAAVRLRGVHLEHSGRAHAAADAHRHQPDAAAALPKLVHELRRELRAVAPSGWPSAIAPPFTFTFSSSHPELAHDRDDLRRERLVELDQLHVVQLTAPRA